MHDGIYSKTASQSAVSQERECVWVELLLSNSYVYMHTEMERTKINPNLCAKNRKSKHREGEGQEAKNEKKKEGDMEQKRECIYCL